MTEPPRNKDRGTREFFWGKNAVCGITMTRLRPGRNAAGEKYVTELKCSHRFYTRAIAQWVMKKHELGDPGAVTCPMCRKKISKKQQTTLALFSFKHCGIASIPDEEQSEDRYFASEHWGNSNEWEELAREIEAAQNGMDVIVVAQQSVIATTFVEMTFV